MIKTRFAPSPTGYLHIGGARTALFAWIFAKKNKGQFLLRIEDTDIARSTKQSTELILKSLQWLGLDWDEGPYYQSDRLPRYQELAETLLAAGHAYWCYASPEELARMREQQKIRGIKPRYDGRWRPENAKGKRIPKGVDPVLRFRNPTDGSVTWYDLVKGKISVENSELDDLIILRGDGIPTYNFGVVVDDADMNITHVIRGDDHINNTPRQLNIFNSLGFRNPTFAHLPMILGSDGERLSKRHGATSVLDFRESGYLPEAVLNYLARLGWGFGNAEKFSIDDMKQWFLLENISKSPAKFDLSKLDWINQIYLKEGANQKLVDLVIDGSNIDKNKQIDDKLLLNSLVGLLKARVKNLNELREDALSFYHYVKPSNEMARKHYKRDIFEAVKYLRSHLDQIEWNQEELGKIIKETVAYSGMKFPQLAIPLRVMVTGFSQSPSLNQIFEVLGRERVCQRIDEEMKRFDL